MTKEEREKRNQSAAEKIRKFLIKHEMWQDTRIYFNGKCFDSNKPNLLNSLDPIEFFSFVNPDTISMSFEGPLYYCLNGYDYPKEHLDFIAILKKYNLYYELGDTWNLTCYEC